MNKIGHASASVKGEQVTVIGQAIPFNSHLRVNGIVLRLASAIGDSLQVESHLRRHVVDIEDTFVGITHDRTEVVVSRNHYKTLISDIKDIETRHTRIVGEGVNMFKIGTPSYFKVR